MKYKKFLKYSLVPAVTWIVVTTGCSTSRTRNSDPIMRVAIDADSMQRESYVRLQKALVESGRFVVVDRAMGFKAVTKEQDLQHINTRFSENEKYALWGQMYGVGGIFIATLQCGTHQSWWTRQYYSECIENLSLINATTGEVMAVAENKVDADERGVAPEWSEVVDKVIDNYPKYFVNNHNPNQTIEYTSTLEEYREKTVPQHRRPAETPSELTGKVH